MNSGQNIQWLMGSPKEICSAEWISCTVFCKLLKIQLLPQTHKTPVMIFTRLPLLNWRFMLISLFLYTYCVLAQLGMGRKNRCCWNRQQTPHPRYNSTWISSVNFSAIATWSIRTNLSCQCLFRVSLGNNPETSSWHCWGVVQRAPQPQPDPHSSQHSRPHRHDGRELLQQPARRQCLRNITSQRPR